MGASLQQRGTLGAKCGHNGQMPKPEVSEVSLSEPDAELFQHKHPHDRVIDVVVRRDVDDLFPHCLRSGAVDSRQHAANSL